MPQSLTLKASLTMTVSHTTQKKEDMTKKEKQLMQLVRKEGVTALVSENLTAKQRQFVREHLLLSAQIQTEAGA